MQINNDRTLLATVDRRCRTTKTNLKRISLQVNTNISSSSVDLKWKNRRRPHGPQPRRRRPAEWGKMQITERIRVGYPSE